MFVDSIREQVAVASAELLYVTPGATYGSVPFVEDGAVKWYLCIWQAPDKEPDQPWPDFVAASIAFAKEWLAKWTPESSLPPGDGIIYYLLDLESAETYPERHTYRWAL